MGQTPDHQISKHCRHRTEVGFCKSIPFRNGSVLDTLMVIFMTVGLWGQFTDTSPAARCISGSNPESLGTDIFPALRKAKNPRHVAAHNILVSRLWCCACQIAFNLLKMFGKIGNLSLSPWLAKPLACPVRSLRCPQL